MPARGLVAALVLVMAPWAAALWLALATVIVAETVRWALLGVGEVAWSLANVTLPVLVTTAALVVLVRRRVPACSWSPVGTGAPPSPPAVGVAVLTGLALVPLWLGLIVVTAAAGTLIGRPAAPADQSAPSTSLVT